MSDWMLNFLSSAAVSGLVTAALIWLSKQWISERLKRAIQHEYDVALERLRGDLAREQALHREAVVSFTAGHMAAHERRLQAIQILWSGVVRLRQQAPAVLTLADIFSPEQIRQMPRNPKAKAELLDALSDSKILSLMATLNDVEPMRPFLGEPLWSLFFAYRAFTGRLLVLFLQGRDKGQVEYWRDDDGVRQLLAAVMTVEEMKELDRPKYGSVEWVRSMIEQKLLQRANDVISGAAVSKATLEQAQMILRAATDVEQKSRGM